MVAVAGVASGSGCDKLTLGKFAGERLGDRDGRISSSRHAHRLVDVATTGERVADCAANTSCRPTERLDLGRMVVGLVLEEIEPILLHAVDIDLDLDRAGVDFLGLI